MRKRKERVEKWREEQRKKAIENIGEIKKELEEMKQGKKWSLEDDDGEDEDWNVLVQEKNSLKKYRRLIQLTSFQMMTRIVRLWWRQTMMKKRM